MIKTRTFKTIMKGCAGMTFRRGFLTFVATVGLVTPVKAGTQTVVPSAPKVASVAASARADMMVLTVNKTALTAELRTWPDDPAQASLLRSFRIAIGKAEGDKEREGDNKTPEGIYFAQSHIDGKALPDKYGPLAIPLDFPNPIDAMAGKTGHGIWLHGVDRDQRIEEAKVTEGCVAFYNPDIARLSSWLRSHQGVVVIASDEKQVNRAADIDAVRQRTLSWMSAWGDRKIDDYMAHYSQAFRYDSYDYKGYKEYKGRVFKSYKTITLNFDNLRVVSHPKYAISFFNQDFHGDNRFSSVGRKVLYWERGADNQWYVRREVFENRRFESVTFTDAELALLSDQKSSISADDKDKKAPSL